MILEYCFVCSSKESYKKCYNFLKSKGYSPYSSESPMLNMCHFPLAVFAKHDVNNTVTTVSYAHDDAKGAQRHIDSKYTNQKK